MITVAVTYIVADGQVRQMSWIEDGPGKRSFTELSLYGINPRLFFDTDEDWHLHLAAYAMDTLCEHGFRGAHGEGKPWISKGGHVMVYEIDFDHGPVTA